MHPLHIILTQMNVQLANVTVELPRLTGHRIVRPILAGKRQTKLAALIRPRGQRWVLHDPSRAPDDFQVRLARRQEPSAIINKTRPINSQAEGSGTAAPFNEKALSSGTRTGLDETDRSI
jgi:hypothetical protein